MLTALLLLLLGWLQTPQSSPPTCAGQPVYARLDFWVGEWDVYVQDRKVGMNKISKILSGCAVLEEWEDAGGGRGVSLFYVNPREGRWKQVWVTDQAFRRGGTKEKALLTVLPDGGLRFEGELPLPSQQIHDRTTLWALPDGRVRQLIEFSDDGKKSWKISFDGLYVRKGAASRQ